MPIDKHEIANLEIVTVENGYVIYSGRSDSLENYAGRRYSLAYWQYHLKKLTRK